MRSCFNDNPYVHSPLPLQWHRWTVYYITCDRMEAAVFSPCLTHVENVHSGRSPVFDCKIVKHCLKWNQTPKHEELLLRLNCNLTTNPKHWHLQMKLKHPFLLKMTLHCLTLKGAQKKDKTPSELQWNWLELQCWLIKTVHRLIPQCALTGLREKWREVQSGDEAAEAATVTLLSYWLSWWLTCWVTVALGFIHPKVGKADMTGFKHICCCL